MSDNYLQPVNNYFSFDESKLEDVDDNAFLKNTSRIRSSNNGNGSGSNIPKGGAIPRHSNDKDEKVIDGTENDPVYQQKQTYEQKRREIEERSLQSTQRSLGILYDTEEIGNSTAVELSKQREQLERTNKNLDDINATLRYSQRHLNGIKSVFGSLKNYFSGANRENPPPTTSTNAANNTRKMSADSNVSEGINVNRSIEKTLAVSPTEKYDQHPISRIRDDSTNKQQLMQSQQAKRSNPFEEQLESNLNEMCDNLSRLKGLATDLSTEIDTQNELIDNMNYKIEDVDIKLGRQNNDIHKLLGKK